MEHAIKQDRSDVAVTTLDRSDLDCAAELAARGMRDNPLHAVAIGVAPVCPSTCIRVEARTLYRLGQTPERAEPQSASLMIIFPVLPPRSNEMNPPTAFSRPSMMVSRVAIRPSATQLPTVWVNSAARSS